MYVAPRPHVDDDPLFAVRLSSAAVVGFGLAILLQSPMPMLPPALIVGLIAGIRTAFDPKKAVGGPVAMVIMVRTDIRTNIIKDSRIEKPCLYCEIVISFMDIKKSSGNHSQMPRLDFCSEN